MLSACGDERRDSAPDRSSVWSSEYDFAYHHKPLILVSQDGDRFVANGRVSGIREFSEFLTAAKRLQPKPRLIILKDDASDVVALANRIERIYNCNERECYILSQSEVPPAVLDSHGFNN